MTNDRLKILLEESFYASTVFLAVLAVLELVLPRMVLAYVNLNFLLFVWLVIAMILVVVSGKGKKEN